MQAGGIESLYPYSMREPAASGFGMAVYSRRELLQPESFDVGDGYQKQQRAEVELDGQRVAIYNIHLFTPIAPRIESWQRRQQEDLLTRLEREQLPFLVAGDFNATEHTAFYQRITRLSTNGFEQASGGIGATWPQNVIPLIRIDHIFLSPELGCRNYTFGKGAGSDHIPQIATIGIREDLDEAMLTRLQTKER